MASAFAVFYSYACSRNSLYQSNIRTLRPGTMAAIQGNNVGGVAGEQGNIPAANLNLHEPVQPMQDANQNGPGNNPARRRLVLMARVTLMCMMILVILAPLNGPVDVQIVADATSYAFLYVSSNAAKLYDQVVTFLRKTPEFVQETVSPNPQPVPQESEGPKLSPEEVQQLIMPFNFSDSNFTNSQDLEKAIRAINQIFFAEYVENNMCDVNFGILMEDFNSSVSKIAELLQFPAALTESIVDAGNFKQGKGNAVKMLNFKGTDGFLYFGKFAVVKASANYIFFSYSLHGVKCTLAPPNVQLEAAQEFVKFFEAIENGQPVTQAFFNKQGIDHFQTYFMHKAYEEFERNCGNMAKNIAMVHGATETADQLNGTGRAA